MACRRAVRAAGSAIRAVHRRREQQVETLLAESRAALREAQAVLAPYSAVAFAGFLGDAEREYAEAELTLALVAGTAVPTHDAIGVAPTAWLNGLAEAASELRRQLLDRLRAGQMEAADRLLTAMDDTYELLVGVDFPDAVTGGLRQRTDALRAVLERTRSDLTTTSLQVRLQGSLDRATGGPEPRGR